MKLLAFIPIRLTLLLILQDDLTKQNLKKELSLILNGEAREKQLSSYNELIKKLGGAGASSNAASLIIENAKTA